MNFRIEIDIDRKHKGEISLGHSLIMFGSCFTTNVGEKLLESGFDVSVNPFGTLYNPLSIERSIKNALESRSYTPENLIEDGNGIWHSLDFHSAFSSSNQSTVIERINEAIKACHIKILTCDWIIITLGTSYVYRWKADGSVVANCHKLNPSCFQRTLLTPADTEESLSRLIKAVRRINKNVKFIFTVSPIRHKADGLHGNQISKAGLLLAVDNIVRNYDDVIYFPSYEIMMDDLRDYRFYDDDMVHPSKTAIRYIFNLFTDMFMTPQTINQCNLNAKTSLHRKHRTLIN